MMVGDSYPFNPADAENLIAQWQSENRVAPQLSSKDLMGRIAGEGLAEPTEIDYQMMSLTPIQLLKRRAFIRHFRSANVYVWKRVLMTHMPLRTGQVMDGAFGLLESAGKKSAEAGKQIRLDVLLYDELVDNFTEEGFLSVGLHVIQRLSGDVEKHPENLVNAVDFADNLDKKYHSYQYLL
ncbi:MAG: hypothetical protein HQL71_13320 [Magnetococcales bacterium]|nr:hypothetical protein [Magnetococcales bacterium]